MHVNLFSAGHTRSEVYQALLDHQKRDARTLHILDGVTLIALIGALTDYHGWSTALWVVAAFGAGSAIRYFVDLSNRNHFLHRLDWEAAAGSDEPRLQ